WHYIVATKSGTNVVIYLDGVIAATFSNACVGSLSNASSVEIGGLSALPPTHFTGLIDEVALWSRALTPAEVGRIWAAGSEGMCRESWWVPSTVLAQAGVAHVKPVICSFGKPAFTAHYTFAPTPQGGSCTAP